MSERSVEEMLSSDELKEQWDRAFLAMSQLISSLAASQQSLRTNFRVRRDTVEKLDSLAREVVSVLSSQPDLADLWLPPEHQTLDGFRDILYPNRVVERTQG